MVFWFFFNRNVSSTSDLALSQPCFCNSWWPASLHINLKQLMSTNGKSYWRKEIKCDPIYNSFTKWKFSIVGQQSAMLIGQVHLTRSFALICRHKWRQKMAINGNKWLATALLVNVTKSNISIITQFFSFGLFYLFHSNDLPLTWFRLSPKKKNQSKQKRRWSTSPRTLISISIDETKTSIGRQHVYDK